MYVFFYKTFLIYPLLYVVFKFYCLAYIFAIKCLNEHLVMKHYYTLSKVLNAITAFYDLNVDLFLSDIHCW